MVFLGNTDVKAEKQISTSSQSDSFIEAGQRSEPGIFKAYVPNVLYKPPYGMPRKVNVALLRALARNPYVFSVTKTICDEIIAVPWDIKVKDEFQEDGKDYAEEIKEIKKFFNNPNGNAESFEHITRGVVTDILEADSGVIVKVFNKREELSQMFARDGTLFLKNPNVYGYIGDRSDFVPPLPDGFTRVGFNTDSNSGALYGRNDYQDQLVKQYDVLFKNSAAYFQYGWTAGSMPVPFGKKEIIYFMQNPRTDSIYGRSPLQILENLIYILVYGSEANLDFYMRNNMPEGMLSILGGETKQLKAFKQQFESKFRFKDGFDNERKEFFNIPITSQEVKWTPFSLSPKDLELISQQEWFLKLVWACFGVTASEMGWTENSNKSTDDSQTKVSGRKAIQPLLKTLAYNWTTQLIPEFFDVEFDDFRNVPLEFVYDFYDVDEDKQKHDILEQEIRMGVKTPDMVAEELGINVEELNNSLEKKRAMDLEDFNARNTFDNPMSGGDPKKEVSKEVPKNIKKDAEEKSSEVKSKDILKESPLKQIEKEIEEDFKKIIDLADNLPNDLFKNES